RIVIHFSFVFFLLQPPHFQQVKQSDRVTGQLQKFQHTACQLLIINSCQCRKQFAGNRCIRGIHRILYDQQENTNRHQKQCGEKYISHTHEIAVIGYFPRWLNDNPPCKKCECHEQCLIEKLQQRISSNGIKNRRDKEYRDKAIEDDRQRPWMRK